MHERKAKMTELCDAFVACPAASARSTRCSKRGRGTRWAITPSRSPAQRRRLLDAVRRLHGACLRQSGFLSQTRLQAMLVGETPDEAINLLDEAAAGATQGIVW